MGVGLLAFFAVVLVIFFLPVLDGQNPMSYLDSLYNSISKQSAYHISELKEETARQQAADLRLELEMGDATTADQAAAILAAGGMMARATGETIELQGDLPSLLAACLDDSDLMFANDDGALRAKYGLEGRAALFRWWQVLKQVDKGLKRESRFEEAKLLGDVKKKGLEAAYNYYGIEPVHIKDKLGAVILSLAFYVLYTIWYGYAIIFIFEGCGLRLSH
jgi:hypothetical protein